MKFIFLVGGVLGFVIAAATGWISGREPERILMDASLGCITGALLFRWFWSVVLQGMREVYLAQQRAALAAPPLPAPAAAGAVPTKAKS